MILLDTNALIWLEREHPRSRPLKKRGASRLYVSPATVLELQLLVETGRIRLTTTVNELLDDDRWSVDDPPAIRWFDEARALGWTRDPFDRLLVAHALLRKWPLATGDAHLLDHLDARKRIAL